MVYAATKVKQKAFFVLFYTLEFLSCLFTIISNYLFYWIAAWYANRDLDQVVAEYSQSRVLSTVLGLVLGLTYFSYSFAVWIFAVKYLQISFSIENSISQKPANKYLTIATTVVTYAVPLAFIAAFSVFFTYLMLIVWHPIPTDRA